MAISAIATAAGLSLDVKEVLGLEPRWWALIAFVIFFVLVVWLIIELYIKNMSLEGGKPSISVVPTSSQDLWYLEVTNNGAEATFSAVVIAVPEQANAIGERWRALWAETMTGETKLMNGQTDEIKIASIKYLYSEEYFVMHAYSIARKVRSLARQIARKQFISKTPITIQVIVSSSPAPKDGKPFVKTYSISSHHIRESKHQLKRLDSFPGELTFDDHEPAY